MASCVHGTFWHIARMGLLMRYIRLSRVTTGRCVVSSSSKTSSGRWRNSPTAGPEKGLSSRHAGCAMASRGMGARSRTLRLTSVSSRSRLSAATSASMLASAPPRPAGIVRTDTTRTSTRDLGHKSQKTRERGTAQSKWTK